MPPKKQINPKCPKCERRVPYVIDSYDKGKRIRLCSRCYADWIQRQSVQQLEMEFPKE